MEYVVVALVAMGGLIILLAAGLLTLEKRLIKMSGDVAWARTMATVASASAAAGSASAAAASRARGSDCISPATRAEAARSCACSYVDCPTCRNTSRSVAAGTAAVSASGGCHSI